MTLCTDHRPEVWCLLMAFCMSVLWGPERRPEGHQGRGGGWRTEGVMSLTDSISWEGNRKLPVLHRQPGISWCLSVSRVNSLAFPFLHPSPLSSGTELRLSSLPGVALRAARLRARALRPRACFSHRLLLVPASSASRSRRRWTPPSAPPSHDWAVAPRPLAPTHHLPTPSLSSSCLSSFPSFSPSPKLSIWLSSPEAFFIFFCLTESYLYT